MKSRAVLFLLLSFFDKAAFALDPAEYVHSKDYPWQAFLTDDGANANSLVCSAAIISDRFIVTAAHCLTGDEVEHPGALRVHTGANQQFDPSSHIRSIVKVFTLKNFPPSDGASLEGDIVLLKTRKKIPFSERTSAVELPDEAQSERDLLEDGMERSFWFAGWGSDGGYGLTGTDTFLPIARVDEPLYQIPVKSTKDVHSDFGDSGGGLVLERGSKQVLIGILSSGFYDRKKPELFVSVHHYQNWMRAVLNLK